MRYSGVSGGSAVVSIELSHPKFLLRYLQEPFPHINCQVVAITMVLSIHHSCCRRRAEAVQSANASAVFPGRKGC